MFDLLLPNRVVTDRLVVGIQGGRGSFNEDAARYYMSRTPEVPVEIVYLHTTERVLRALHEGEVDRGVFAIHNSVGGMVGESVAAMARYRFAIVEEFAIKIAHALMIADWCGFLRGRHGDGASTGAAPVPNNLDEEILEPSPDQRDRGPDRPGESGRAPRQRGR